jgi:hypothetical protein
MREDSAQLKQLFPTLSSDELAAAKELLDAYLLLVWEIWEEHSTGSNKVQSKSMTSTNPQLTPVGSGSSIQAKVDSPQKN